MGPIDEVVAELQRERRKNAKLLDRISALEAQIQDEGEKGPSAKLMSHSHSQGNCDDSGEERRVKRHKIESTTEDSGSIKIRENNKPSSVSEVRHENGLVEWISTDEVLPLEIKSRDAESTLDSEDTDDSDDEDEPYPDEYPDNHVGKDENIEMNSIDMGEAKKNERFRNLSLQKKPPKVGFCPKEVKGILVSKTLALKNAYSHTMRKIIVFASLGIRHGCDDMYELDYHHFSIFRKGEPYISADNPGEHVLYENPGVKRKIFYPNQHNPTLCPIQILEEEKAMRSSDANCPSCLFLCIKYGGRTRNIPQNEYVRQRMGRNKLKSFGPLICQTARLVNIRTGSFFFKALGITLLFMAGFSDDIVQRETKYRNLDLLQKYFRTDEDAAGEKLFHTNSSPSDLDSLTLQKPNSKATAKTKGKKQMNSSSSPQETPSTSSRQNPPQTLIDFSTIQRPESSSTVFNYQPPNISYNHHHSLYPVFPPQPISPVMPWIYWPSSHNTTYPPCPYPSSYSYHSLSALNGGQCISFRPQPYYTQGLFRPCNSVVIPRPVERMKRDDVQLDEAAISDSESSSGPK